MTEQAPGLDHNAFATDGREANRQFWTAFFAGIPDLSRSFEDAADDAVAGDDQRLHWVRRRAERARRLVRTVTEGLIATINHREPIWPPSTVRL
jgi:predicted SnoaL-like aldol condensation-catalyzing enzyme